MRTLRSTVGVCDFCSSRRPRWHYPTRDFEVIEGVVGSKGGWNACDPCHELIENDDREGLAIRAAVRYADEHNVPRNVAYIGVAKSHKGFWENAIGLAEPLETGDDADLPPEEPQDLAPIARTWQDVLDVQVDLWRWWQSPDGLMYARAMTEQFGGDDKTAVGMIQALAKAEPISVNEDVMDLVEAAEPNFEPEPLYPQDLWTPAGFVVLPRPFYFTDNSGRTMGIVAFNWLPITANNPVPEHGKKRYTAEAPPDTAEGSFFWFYADREDLRDWVNRQAIVEDLAPATHRLVLTHLTPWWYARRPPEEGEEDYTTLPLWRWLGAFFRLGQERIVARSSRQPQRAVRRRAERSGGVEPRNVTVVTLRRARQKRESEAHSVDWQVRWPVRGHWRWQWYPTLDRHRQKWIPSYVKGPEDKPFKAPLRAFEFKR